MASVTSNQRQGWIDQYRGLLFFLVIINHTFKAPISLQHFIDFVYLPGFFFLSGYLFKPKGYKKNFISIMNSLFIPFLIFSTIISLYTAIIDKDIYHFWITFFDYFVLGGDGIWFIPCLIVVELLFSIISNICDQKRYILILGLCSILFAYWVGDEKGNHLPWNFDTALYCISFFAIGHLIKGKDNISSVSSSFLFLFYVINTQIIGSELYTNINVDLHNNVIGNYFVYIILSLTGSISLFILCRYLPVLWYFEKIGKYTLFSFPFHPFIYRAIVKLFSLFKSYGGDSNLLIDIFLIPFLTGLVLIVICMLLEKKAPYLLGRYKYISIKNPAEAKS